MTDKIEKSENKIQQEIFTWYNNTFCLKHHQPRCLIASIPNGGKRDPREAMTLKGTGLYTGFSDLIVIHVSSWLGEKCIKTMYVEVKTPSGILSSDQKEFMNHVESLGQCYHVVRSLDEFQSLIHAL